MFQKQGKQDENLATVRATLILALGYVARRVDLNRLPDIIERSILSSLGGFLDKPQDMVQQSLLHALQNVSLAIESMIDNSDEQHNILFLQSF